jgi:hypothetical protein
MAGIPDNELVAQLNAFMRSVIAQWTRDQLAALGHEKHVEYRGPETSLITFDLYLLENEVNADRPYLNVAVSACDFREGKGLGSAYAPLYNNFPYYSDGSVDAQELSKFAYMPGKTANPALNRTGRYKASFLLASARPAG